MLHHHWGEFIYVLLMSLLRAYDGLTYCYDLYISCPTGILAIAKTCAVVVDVKELFEAESESQVYAHLHELLTRKEMSLIGRVEWYFCMRTCDNIVQVLMLLTSMKVVICNPFARDVFYCNLRGAIVNVCNELYPLYQKWFRTRSVGKSQGLINSID